MTFPSAIPVRDLRVTHAEYSGPRIANYDALYRGSDAFRKRLDDFLIKRKVEEKGLKFGLNANELYLDRQKWAHYVNRAGGLIDWLVAAVFGNTLRIEAPEDKSGYWQGLNENADGRGTPLPAAMRRALCEMMVQGRCYLYPLAQADVAQPGDADSMAMFLRHYPAKAVDDWSSNADDNEDLDWIRIHAVNAIRSTAIGPADQERELWSFVTDDAVYTYSAERGDADAVLIDTNQHAFGRLPVFPVQAFPGQWVMDRVADVAVALFNTEAGLGYSVALQAYSQLVLKLEDSKPESIVLSELAAIGLRPNESAEYLSPPKWGFQPQFDSIARLKDAFYEVLQSMARNAESIPQAGRLSGVAVQAMQTPLQVLLASLGWPVLTAFKQWVDAVKAFRGDTFDVRIISENEFPSDTQALREAAMLGDEEQDNGTQGARDGDDADDDDDDTD